MSWIDRRTLSVLFTTLLVASGLWIAWAARRPLLAFLFAIFFAYLLEPVVSWLERLVGGSRLRAIALTYATIIGTLIVAAIVAAPAVATQASALSRALPGYARQVSSGTIARTVGEQHGWSGQTTAALQRWLVAHQDSLTAAAQDVAARTAELSANAGWVLLIPIFALFVLKDKAALGDGALNLVPDRFRGFFGAVIRDVDRMLAHYIRAQLLLVLAGLVAYTAFLSLIRFPYALGLGVMAGLLEFIPFVGPAITAVVLFMVGFFGGYPHWVIVLAFVAVWRLVQDYVTSPYLMGEGLELHPLAAILGVLVGGEIAGIAGMFLSIPVIAALRIIWRNLKRVDDATDSVTEMRTPAHRRARSG